MINGLTLDDASAAPTDSTGVLDRVQKYWGSFRTSRSCRSARALHPPAPQALGPRATLSVAMRFGTVSTRVPLRSKMMVVMPRRLPGCRCAAAEPPWCSATRSLCDFAMLTALTLRHGEYDESHNSVSPDLWGRFAFFQRLATTTPERCVAVKQCERFHLWSRHIEALTSKKAAAADSIPIDCDRLRNAATVCLVWSFSAVCSRKAAHERE
jgi:hypothetical protein